MKTGLERINKNINVYLMKDTLKEGLSSYSVTDIKLIGACVLITGSNPSRKVIQLYWYMYIIERLLNIDELIAYLLTLTTYAGGSRYFGLSPA